MKRWILFILVILIVTISFTGCKESTDEEVYYKFQKKINKLDSYSCIATINVCGNKSIKEYEASHYFKSPSYYKLETLNPSNIKGKTTIYDDDKIIIKNPKYNDELKFTNRGIENRYLFVGDFLKNIFENEDLKIGSDKYFLILETNIPGSSFYFNKQKIYVDKKTLKPNKLEIMDVNLKKRFVVNYKEFKYNGD